MTGIEMLRDWAEDMRWDFGDTGKRWAEKMSAIADQIEAEQNVGDREEYEAAAWVREHGGIDHVRTMVATLDDALDGRERRDPAADVSVSAYDLLPEEEREAVAWVREYGGLEAVRRMFQDACNRRVELCGVLGIDLDTGWSDATAALDRRLMPEGCEWPRYDTGEPVRIGGAIADELGCVHEVTSVEIFDNGADLRWNPDEPEECVWVGRGDRVRRPAPKVLDADGVEIREKCDVWWICEGDERGVHAERLRVETICPNGLIECSPYNGGTWVHLEPSELYVNKPVPSSDGRPLREGDYVWDMGGNGPYEVVGFTKSGYVRIKSDFGLEQSAFGERLTHERPESKCRDCAHWQKDPTADNMGVCWFFYHEYEGEDCYAARRADIGACEEFMPRASALAERERGE